MLYNDIRLRFINFFIAKDHKQFKYNSIMPSHDPSLLFINSGMAPLKNYFIGNSKPPYKNLVSCQPCLRVGGKHNDLEEVGHSKRHLTFFQMLGNFSFGDLKPKEAIDLALEFLLDILNLKQERLYITIHPNDIETIKIWENKPDFQRQIFYLNENSWSAGDFGPRGYCTEFFYDLGKQYLGSLPGEGETGERYIEIWNLVFMHEHVTKNAIIQLDKKCIDTGAGLERLDAVVNANSPDIFQSNVLRSLLELMPEDNLHARIIADHLRSIVFMFADGLKPGPNTEAYILRRLIRRVYRQLSFFSGNPIKIISPLIDKIIDLEGKYYPHILNIQDILELFDKEFTQFQKNWADSINILNSEMNKSTSKVFSGEIAFLLHDTYGFPLDLTIEILKEHNFIVNLEEYNSYMSKQKSQSNQLQHKNYLIFQGIEEIMSTKFIYDQLKISTKILMLYNLEGKKVDSFKEGGYIITQDTNYYILGGGQDPDIGFINNIKIENSYKINQVIVCLVNSGEFAINDLVEININPMHRSQLRIHHTGAHLIHSALKKIDPCIKSVSVNALIEKIKFDFEYQDIEPHIEHIEEIVNNWIIEDLEVSCMYMPYKDALDSGALSSGNKYPDVVRVVSIGNISKELCCGTHVKNLNELCSFKVLEYKSVGKNIKRVCAIAGPALIKHLKTYQHELEIIEQISGHKISELKNILNQDNASKSNTYLAEYKNNVVTIGICRQLKNNEFLQLIKKSNSSLKIFINTIKNKSCVICISETLDALEILKSIVKTNFSGGGNEKFAQCSIDSELNFINWAKKECKNLAL